ALVYPNGRIRSFETRQPNPAAAGPAARPIGAVAIAGVIAGIFVVVLAAIKGRRNNGSAP
ncbi:MAG: hypothetical protein DLM70_14420, partial [Chloroflexi bacterium]